MRCPSCAMEVEPGRPVCQYCGSRLSPEPQYYAQQPYPAPGYYPPPQYGAPPPYAAPPPYMMPPPYAYAPRPRSSTPVAAGVMLLIGGILAMLYGAIIAMVGGLVDFVPGMGTIFYFCGGIEIIFGLISILGGVMAFQRRTWALALTGSILCMLSIGPYFISSILGLIALILVAVSREEFN